MAGRVGNMLSIFLTMESGIGALGAEPPKDFYAATLANSSGWLEALPQGPYTVKTGTIGKIPGLSLGGPYSGHVVYAEGNGEKFPFLSFAHGTGAGGALTLHDYKRALELVASYGFVIVATDSCPTIECFSAFSKDQLATIKACKQDPTLHPALASADFNRTGVYGHSMGGMATLVSAQSPNTKNYGISAAVSMHPCRDMIERPALVDIPIMFTAGSKDGICADSASKSFYESVPVANAGAKILFDVQGANHFDPTEGEPGLFGPGSGSELPAIALFFSCHLRGESCDKVYGASGKEICNQVAANRSLADCRVEGSPSEFSVPVTVLV